MTVYDSARLKALLGADALRWLRQRLRHRLERGVSLDGALTLDHPTPEQREALGRLLGRAPRLTATLRADARRLENELRRAGICESLREAIEALDGPIRDLQAEQETEARSWESMQARVLANTDRHPWLANWWRAVSQHGLLRRASGGDTGHAERLLDQTLDLAGRLPAAGIPLPELAALVAGNAHALDRGTPLGTLGIRAAACIVGTDEWKTALAWREVWARVGIVCDEVSVPVLTLGLGKPGRNAGSLSDMILAMHHEAGELCPLTLRQLLRHAPDLTHLAEVPVFVCENPTVAVAAASRLGLRCRPLICTAGEPGAAAQVLLRQIAEAGGILYARADFDAKGVQITARLVLEFGAAPWRMDATTYRAGRAGPKLKDTVPRVPWDPGLQAAMCERDVAVHEESVLHLLLADLDRAGQPA